MPTYRVTAPDGRVFRLTGDSPPTEQELEQIFGSAGQSNAPQDKPNPLRELPTELMHGVQKFGVGVAEVGNRLASDVKIDGEPMLPYDPNAYAQQRGELEKNQSATAKAARFIGEAAPSLLTTRLPQPAAFPLRVATEAGLGALQGEISGPGNGKIGAALGALGGLFGSSMSGKTNLGRNIAARQERKEANELVRVLSPDKRDTDAAEKATAFLRTEGVVPTTLNPMELTTGPILRRAEEAKSLRQNRLNTEYMFADASGQRFNEAPVRAGLRDAMADLEVSGSRVPSGAKLRLTLADLQDPAVVKHYKIDEKTMKDLWWGKARGGIDYVDVSLPEAVVHDSAKPRHMALSKQEAELARLTREAHDAEAFKLGIQPSQVRPGLKPSAARDVKQSLDFGKYKGTVETPTTAARKLGESEAGLHMRHEINSQFPDIAAENEPFHHMSNAVAMLEQKAQRQERGSIAERYAMVRGLGSLVHGLTLGAITPAAAVATVHSSAYHALNANVRRILADSIRSGKLEDAAKIVTRLAIAGTEANEPKNPDRDLQSMGVRVQ